MTSQLIIPYDICLPVPTGSGLTGYYYIPSASAGGCQNFGGSTTYEMALFPDSACATTLSGKSNPSYVPCTAQTASSPNTLNAFQVSENKKEKKEYSQ